MRKGGNVLPLEIPCLPFEVSFIITSEENKMKGKTLLLTNLVLAAGLGWGYLNKQATRNVTIEDRTPAEVYVDSEHVNLNESPDILIRTRDGTPYLFSGSTGNYKRLDPVGEGDEAYLNRRIDELKNKAYTPSRGK